MKSEKYYLTGTYLTGSLDDILFKHVIDQKITSAEEFNNLLNELYEICEHKWRINIDEKTPTLQFKAALDRTFNSWNVFVGKVRDEEKYLFADLLEKYSYKYVFMNNEKLKECYHKL